MTASVHEQLHAFATTLLERRGALVEWPVVDRAGTAILPPEVAALAGASGEVVPLAHEPNAGGLCVNLAGDFLEWSQQLLDAVPSVGAFRVRDLYLKRKELDEGIRRAFTWLNAKVKLREGRETAVEYHTWWFHVSLDSEDRWETCFRVSLNAASGVEVDTPDPLGLWGLQPRPASPARTPSSYPLATQAAQRRVLRLAAAFLNRMDTRLQRDRKRLRDYYHALLRESERKKVRGHSQADPEQVEAAKRAVDLELRRKLAELDERYAIRAALRPVVLIRTEVPVLAADLDVYRKQAHKKHTLYWNPLLKQFEPLGCSRCRNTAFAVAFANETVEPLCPSCAAGSGKAGTL